MVIEEGGAVVIDDNGAMCIEGNVRLINGVERVNWLRADGSLCQCNNDRVA